MSVLKEQVALITGAGSGIGASIAQVFVDHGAKLALAGRSSDKLHQVASDLPAERVLCCSCDVADRAAVNSMVDEVRSHFGAVSLLVNSAGMNTLRRSVAEVDPEDWDRTVAVNLTGAFNCIRAVLPGMRKGGYGLVINIASIAAKRAMELAGAAYSASKHGMLALTHSLNEEEAEHGIRSTAICPGEVDTPILDRRPEPVGPEHRARILKPPEIAAAALFVASLPGHACVPELIIKPVTQVYY